MRLQVRPKSLNQRVIICIVAALFALTSSGALADDISNGSWSTTDASNNAAPPNGFPAGMFPNQVEPSARSNMGGVKRFWERINPALSTTGSSPHYVLTPSNVSYPTAYTQGEVICAKANFTSVGADDINVNSLGAKPLYISASGGIVAISAGTIRSGGQFCASYDSALNSSAGGFQLIGGAVQATGALLAANNLSDVLSASTSRTNLGLGTAATQNTGTSGANVPLLSGNNTYSGSSTFSGSVTVQSNVVPNANGTVNLGSTSDNFASGFIQAVITGSATYLDTTGTTVRLSPDASWATTKIFAGGVSQVTIVGGTVKFDTYAAGALKTDGSGNISAVTLDVGTGGTGASTAAGARTNLGVTATGADTTYLFRSNNLSDLNSASTARTNLGLGTSATHAATDFLLVANNLSEVTASTAKTNLGIKKADVDLGDINGTSSSQLSGAHSLGARPTTCSAFAVNVSGGTLNGYTSGAYVSLYAGGTSRNDGVSVAFDTTNVYVTVGANGPMIIDGSTFNGTLIGGGGAGRWHVHGVCILL